jgi:predicted DNA-binding transcriptional regulator YafY
VEELRAVAPRPRSAPWLARRFEVSVRTIERDKVLAALPADARAREQALASSLYEAGVDGPASGDGTDRAVTAAIERDVEPLGFLRSPHGWYLIAHCRLRGAVRGFKLGAIEAAELRDERAPARDPSGLKRELDRFDARAFLRA